MITTLDFSSYFCLDQLFTPHKISHTRGVSLFLSPPQFGAVGILISMVSVELLSDVHPERFRSVF